METRTVQQQNEVTGAEVDAVTRTRETRVFVFLTVVLAPALAVAIVGSYGLAIWLYQMLVGPPTGG